MMLRSKRSFIALISGAFVCFVLAYFVRPICFAPLFGVFTTVYIGKIFSPKEGSLLGALVPIPAGLYTIFPAFFHGYQQAHDTGDVLSLIFAGVAGIIILLLAGAIYGFVLGKIMQFINRKETVIL